MKVNRINHYTNPYVYKGDSKLLKKQDLELSKIKHDIQNWDDLSTALILFGLPFETYDLISLTKKSKVSKTRCFGLGFIACGAIAAIVAAYKKAKHNIRV